MENRELPQPLEKEEQKIYFTSYRLLNDSPMKEKLIAHNMRLATKRVYNKFVIKFVIKVNIYSVY